MAVIQLTGTHTVLMMVYIPVITGFRNRLHIIFFTLRLSTSKSNQYSSDINKLQQQSLSFCNTQKTTFIAATEQS